MATTYIPKTFTPKADEITKTWWLVDVSGVVLGRAASEIARILQGKHKATYAAHLDSGDYVVVVNVDKAVLTGKKATEKVVYRHSGYPGGLKTTLYTKNPVEGFRRTVKGMLPKTKLGNSMLKKLMVYAEAEHPHSAQNPQPLELSTPKIEHTKVVKEQAEETTKAEAKKEAEAKNKAATDKEAKTE